MKKIFFLVLFGLIAVNAFAGSPPPKWIKTDSVIVNKSADSVGIATGTDTIWFASGIWFNGNDTVVLDSAFLDSLHNQLGRFAAGSGDITGVTAGTLLSGGGVSGGVTLNVDTANMSNYYMRRGYMLDSTGDGFSLQTVSGNYNQGYFLSIDTVLNGIDSDDRLVWTEFPSLAMDYWVESDAGDTSFLSAKSPNTIIGFDDNLTMHSHSISGITTITGANSYNLTLSPLDSEFVRIKLGNGLNSSFNIESNSDQVLWSFNKDSLIGSAGSYFKTDSAHIDSGLYVSDDITVTGTVDGVDISALNTILAADSASWNDVADSINLTIDTNKITDAQFQKYIGNFIDSTTLDTIQEAHHSTTADSAQNIDTTTATATALAEKIADVAGAMATGNTESGITVTYQDADNTIDYSVTLGTSISLSEMASNSVDSTKIVDNSVAEVDLRIANAPLDEWVLSWETDSSKMMWQSFADKWSEYDSLTMTYVNDSEGVEVDSVMIVQENYDSTRLRTDNSYFIFDNPVIINGTGSAVIADTIVADSIIYVGSDSAVITNSFLDSLRNGDFVSAFDSSVIKNYITGWGGIRKTTANDTTYLSFEGSADFDTTAGSVSIASGALDDEYLELTDTYVATEADPVWTSDSGDYAMKSYIGVVIDTITTDTILAARYAQHADSLIDTTGSIYTYFSGDTLFYKDDTVKIGFLNSTGRPNIYFYSHDSLIGQILSGVAGVTGYWDSGAMVFQASKDGDAGYMAIDPDGAFRADIFRPKQDIETSAIYSYDGEPVGEGKITMQDTVIFNYKAYRGTIAVADSEMTTQGWVESQGYLTSESDGVWTSDSSDYAMKTWVEAEVEDSLDEVWAGLALFDTSYIYVNIDSVLQVDTILISGDKIGDFAGDNLSVTAGVLNVTIPAQGDSSTWADASDTVAAWDNGGLDSTNFGNATIGAEDIDTTGLVVSFADSASAIDTSYAPLIQLITENSSSSIGDYIDSTTLDTIQYAHVAETAGVANSISSYDDIFVTGDMEVVGNFIQWNHRTRTRYEYSYAYHPVDSYLINIESHCTSTGWDDSSAVIHPDVIYIPQGYLGYKYWMIHTPYTNTSLDENPCVVVSNDGITFTRFGTAPDTCPMPIFDVTDFDNGGHLSDPELLYSADGILYAYFRVTANKGVETHDTTYIVVTHTLNGYEWLNRAGEVHACDTIIGPSVSIGSKHLSPTAVLDTSGVYRMFVAEIGGTHNVLVRRSSLFPDSNFTIDTTITTVLLNDTLTKDIWHINIIPKGGDEYLGLFTMASGVGGANSDLYLAYSEDHGLNWVIDSTPTLEPGGGSQWDNSSIYRSSGFWVNEGGREVLQLYYSAMASSRTCPWHTGLTYITFDEFGIEDTTDIVVSHNLFDQKAAKYYDTLNVPVGLNIPHYHLDTADVDSFRLTLPVYSGIESWYARDSCVNGSNHIDTLIFSAPTLPYAIKWCDSIIVTYRTSSADTLDVAIKAVKLIGPKSGSFIPDSIYNHADSVIGNAWASTAWNQGMFDPRTTGGGGSKPCTYTSIQPLSVMIVIEGDAGEYVDFGPVIVWMTSDRRSDWDD